MDCVSLSRTTSHAVTKHTHTQSCERRKKKRKKTTNGTLRLYKYKYKSVAGALSGVARTRLHRRYDWAEQISIHAFLLPFYCCIYRGILRLSRAVVAAAAAVVSSIKAFSVGNGKHKMPSYLAPACRIPSLCFSFAPCLVKCESHINKYQPTRHSCGCWMPFCLCHSNHICFILRLLYDCGGGDDNSQLTANLYISADSLL